MIASVRGQLIARDEEGVVIECGGVGYRLAVSAETLKAAPAVGQEAFLFSEMIVRDDSISLYGFSSEAEREMFNLLITVSGVGPRVAISALSTATPRHLAQALVDGDAARFQAVPGIGKRTAERIILELQYKVDGIAYAKPAATQAEGGTALELARAGLMGLGYDSAEAERLLGQVDGENAQDLIAAALREAAGGRGR